jgi:poly-gamma-glutamate synthesis protein (capsule biosynthesis protein)
MLELKTTLLAFVSLFSSLLFPTENLAIKISSTEPSMRAKIPTLNQNKKQEISIKKLDYDSIFLTDHRWTQALPESETITLITTGDVIPARTVNWLMTKYQSFIYPFQKTASFLKTADLTLINLEAPLIANCPLTNEGMVFCGNQKFIEGLLFAGIDVVNLANNHSLNWSPEGLCQTVKLLSQNEILVNGLPPNFRCQEKVFEPLTVKTLKNLKIGFLGFNFLEEDWSKDFLVAISRAKKEVDFLIVSSHWGAEYQRLPSSTTIKLAHQMIEAGADLLVGNHPHWYQPLEIYQEGLIIYAHGNFIFDQEWSLATKTGFIAKHTLYKGKLVDTQIFPIFIQNYSQPYFLEGQEKKTVLKNLKEISQNLQANP